MLHKHESMMAEEEDVEALEEADLNVGDFKKVANFGESKEDGVQKKFFKGQSIELSYSDFPQLKGEEEGDKVMLTLIGPVLLKGKDSVRLGVSEVAMVHGKKPSLGNGERFKALVEKLRSRKVGQTERGRKLARALPGRTGPVRNPAALAAYIGRKKFGKARFQKLAATGRRRLFG